MGFHLPQLSSLLGHASEWRTTTRHIYDPDVFRTILQRERALVHRNGHMFSLLIMHIPETGQGAQSFRTLMKVLVRRLRETDDLGWIDPTQVGAILKYTCHEGTRKLAEDVSRRLAERGIKLAYRVITCPSPDGGPRDWCDDPRQRHFGEVYPNWCPESTAWAGSAMVNGLPASSVSATAPADATTQSDRNTPHVVEALFTCPIPVWKRIMDVTLGSLALLVLGPLFLMFAAFIKLVSPGPVFFKQERIGYLGEPFMCWKFRSMRMTADHAVHRNHLKQLITSDTPMAKLDNANDPRLIPLGRLLRATGLDELPQLFNVIRGEMSLVGPRPCLGYEYENYLRWHKRRFDMLPGITGLWQVSGKNKTTFTEMIRFDIAYERNRSFWLDMKILVKTVPVLVFQALEMLLPRKEGTDYAKARAA